ncbi:MAG: DAK2 domain-containing protein [Bacillota bacterium]
MCKASGNTAAHEGSPSAGELMALDGTTIKQLMERAAALMGQHVDEVNALNVFPVPDGDTGTNMALTIKSAAQEAARVESHAAGEVLEGAALGALMGARGNSGVILSQVFRGIAQSAKGKSTLTPTEFAEALKQGVATAYKAVMKPVEGTILTVARESIAAAEAAAASGKNLAGMLQAALEAGRVSLEMTPRLLPVLREAGVVDAGGRGFLILLEGWYTALTGEALAQQGSEQLRVAPKVTAGEAPEGASDLRYLYDTQFLVRGKGLEAEKLRAELEELGDCLLVVGSDSVLRVHIHSDHPGLVLEKALRFGELTDLDIQNMRLQCEAKAESHVKEIGVVAVASGRGLVEVLKSLGTDLVLDGGKTMNPSTQEVLDAVNSVNAKKVIFLPNNRNTFLAAKQAKRMARKRMYVVPSKNIPEGVCALLAMRPELGVEANLKLMGKAIRRCMSGEVTYAVRETGLNGLKVKSGDVIGIINGELVAAGGSPEEVLNRLVKAALRPEYEVLTVFVGELVPPGKEQDLAQKLSSAFPGIEVEVHRGDQPLHYYLFFME